jgi:hypothetical protein
MTAAQPLTASAFLFDDEDTGRALARTLDEHGVPGSLNTALGLVAQTTRDLVVAGWRKQGQLAAAAERTAANPGTSELVELATHRVSSVHHPYVELLVNDVRVTTVNFELDLEFEIKALVATMRAGHLVSLHSGDCDLSATLAAEGVQLASRRAQLELPLIVRWPLRLDPDGRAGPLP